MTASRLRYYLAPVTDPTDRYAAGFDANAFSTLREAYNAARSLQRLGGEWNAHWCIVHIGSAGQVCCNVRPLKRARADA